MGGPGGVLWEGVRGEGGGDNPKVLNEPLSSLQMWMSVRTRPTVRTASVWTRQAPTTASAHLHGRWPLTVTVAWPRRSRQVSGRARKSVGDPQRQHFGKQRFVRGEAALATHHAAHAGALLYKPARHKTGVFFFCFLFFASQDEQRWRSLGVAVPLPLQEAEARRAWVLVSGTGRHFYAELKEFTCQETMRELPFVKLHMHFNLIALHC